MFIKQTHQLQQLANWDFLGIDSYHYQAPNPRQSIYIQAWLHGTELVWTPVIYELMEYMTQNHSKLPILSDTNFVFVPIANPLSTNSQIMGLQTGYNEIHLDPQNCYNPNRLWYTHPKPIQNTIISKLFALSKDSETVIDLHCAGYESALHIYCNANLVEETKKFGIQNIISRDEAWSCFEDENRKMWKKTFTLELGASRQITYENIQNGLSFLKKYLFWQGGSMNCQVRDLEQLVSFYAPFWWFVVRHIDIWKKIQKWQIFASIYTRDGKQDIVAEYDFIFLIKNPIHAVYRWQEMMQVLRL